MFVGRERELALLEAALTRSPAVRGGVHLLAGEPGIGKTRLAAEAAAIARERGIGVTWGRCWEAGGAPALWPWREALEAIGLAFPDPAAIVASDVSEARFAFFREVTVTIAAAAAREPLLVVLEDLHAADRSTLLLLEHLATQLRTLPVLVVGTYRQLEASLVAETGDALARIGRLGQVLHLAPLREPDVAALVRDAIDGADERLAASVFDTTRGNPLFVHEIVQDIRAHGTAQGRPVPLGVREIIRQRLALVSDDVRTALEAGAVLGVEFGAARVERMVEGAATVLDDAARASGLVTAHGHRLRFSHALYREALYHDLPRARRQRLHRGAAHALAATDAPLAEIAHHLLEAGPDAAAEAIDHAVRAAALALDTFAFEDATALLESARAAIPPGPLEAVLRCRVSIALGEARIRTGDTAGRELCIDAARIARELGDAELLARAGLAYGAVFTMGMVDRVLVDMLADALARLPAGDSAVRASVMARLAASRQPDLGALDRDVRLATEAIAMARRVGDRHALLAVLQWSSGALYGAEDPRMRVQYAREQERLAEQLGNSTRLLQARSRLAMDLLEMGDFAGYAELTAAYEALANRIGRVGAPWRAALMRSMSALVGDRFAESERWQEESRRIESQQPRARLAQAFHRLGFVRAAERHADIRAGIAEERGMWMTMPIIGTAVADARAASNLARIGADDEVRATLRELPRDTVAQPIVVPWVAEATWLAGDAELAVRLLPSLRALSERWTYYWLDCEIVEAPVTRLVALLEGIVGDWTAAERSFADALRKVEAAGRRAMAARMRFELADLMVRCDREPARAAALLGEARTGALAAGVPDLAALVDRRHPAARAPGRARLPTAPTPAFAIALEGETYAVATARGPLRFKASRGMAYLAQLVARPGVDVHVLELVGSSDHADRGDAGELVDARAFAAYRARLDALRDQVELAESCGDGSSAERARDEMEAIAREITKATGRGGRARRGDSAVDRARSAVQRRIKDAVDRIAEQDAELGAWLRSAVTTGNYCSFRPR